MVTAGGDCLGALGPFPVDSPWWADVEPVVARIARELDVPVMVLRLLDVEGADGARDGHVTYHVQAARRPADRPLAPSNTEHQLLTAPETLRARWATREGLQEALSWADASLRTAGRPSTGPVEQVKTWNLAGLFRIPTATGPVWLKTTPPFAAHEADVIAAFAHVAPRLAPTVLAADPEGRRVLLDHVPGSDCWNASAATIRAAVSGLATAQAELATRPETIPSGLPNRSPAALVDEVNQLLDGPAAHELTAAELTAVHRLAERLPQLITELEACGLPTTLLHGDFHPGNWRSDGKHTVLVDFSDSHVGHPVLDGLRPREFLSDDQWAHAADAWIATWAACRPGSDPARALALGAPLGHLAYAVRYQQFLDNIEPSERRYHAGDPAETIRAALRA
ncbi:aminoglycoside phosphotransferase family protein [Pseudofrankia inefficax]|uniref:Aminoglycoside phosphotransferase n=1 Tax=Pseudofrankia inefficax (strain DSM 45817 / CECT 9037 / DDB 130130 / EuI1c) TaxID=298654 RepID=E3J3L2_PSEI1|nr:aminoglycoside phosphotransferase family protein [Pseudofrankia inefficax]ADP79349.1 aminoglycoside phosphotransferase [Pseudofrankia inefficax]